MLLTSAALINCTENVVVETTLEVKTKAIACDFHVAVEGYYNKNNARVISKNTVMDCANKLGFFIGPHMQLADPKHCIKDMNEKIQLDKGIIGIKKQCALKKRRREMVLMTYAIESKAKEVNELMGNTEDPKHRYASCRNVSSDERLAATHFNSMKNIKARCETLFNVNAQEAVCDSEKSSLCH